MSNFQGIIIEESLEDTSILKDVAILKTKIEKVTEKHKTPWVEQWTLHTFELLEAQSDTFAQKLSSFLDSQHAWYADFKNTAFHYIVFRDKVFRIDRSKPEQYAVVTQYGLTLGIPDYQLDFSHYINEWKR